MHILTQIKEKSYALSLIQIVLGSLFLAVLAQVKIYLPFTPIPISLQTFGVLMLAVGQGSRNAPLSILLYLLFAFCGLPVLAGGRIDSLWLLGPTAGYLLGFPLAAYLTGRLLEMRKSPSLIWGAFSILMGQACIYFLGVTYLSYVVGGVVKGIQLGLLPFLPGVLIKGGLILSVLKPTLKLKNRLACWE